MSTRELIRAFTALFQLPRRVAEVVTQRIIRQILRGLMVFGRRPSLQAGFVLPTTVLLLLVLTLTVGSIGYRTYTRTVQTVGERQQRVIFNAATPAIDRAKAKLEYLFDAQRDPRFPSGVPRENFLLGMMLNDFDGDGGTRVGSATNPLFVSAHRLDTASGSGYDPYIFPGETRINIGDSGEVGGSGRDNAWRYRADTNQDGVDDATVVYSINMRTPADARAIRDTTNPAERAENLQVRHGPLSNASQNNPNCPGAGGVSENGWTVDSANSTVLRKNFQINAYVVPDNATGSVATLEVHQDRQLDRGNKWGAWFRNDLEIFPGPAFRWNGAMHTEGNLIVGGGSLTSFMISSPDSCYYSQDASEITGITVEQPQFQSQFIAGTVRDNVFANGGNFHIFNGDNRVPITGNDPATPGDNDTSLGVSADNFDSVDEATARNRDDTAVTPADFALDPVILQTQGESVARNVANPAAARPANWLTRRIARPDLGRLQNRPRPIPPYVDDTYRADNRSGPKPNYGRTGAQIGVAGPIGQDISSNAELTRDAPGSADDATAVGLDGYWERRARREGVRLIVGQRLELGDPAGWGGPLQRASRSGPDLTDAVLRQEPLRPISTDCAGWNRTTNSPHGRCNEARQRRSLWDNLAAVQATAVYHADFDSQTGPNLSALDVPQACFASVVHPGSAGTLDRSATFENLAWNFPATAIPGYSTSQATTDLPPVISDFLRGRGTNGWEFYPATAGGADDWSGFISDLQSPGSGLGKALRNLAYLAGDPNGGAPSFTPADNTTDPNVHPYPSFAMWGDFSMLRRVLNLLDTGVVTYTNLSPADKTVLHTAGCTLGLLAYNLDYLNKFVPADHPLLGTTPVVATVDGIGTVDNLREAIAAIRAGISPLGTIRDLAFMEGSRTTGNQTANNPEVYVRLLERWRDAVQRTGDPTADVTNAVSADVNTLNNLIYLAQMTISKYQVERDRRSGFIGSGRQANNVEVAPSCPADSTDPLFYLCSIRPRYPVLYNLFPSTAHADVSNTGQVGRARDTVDSGDSYLQASNSAITFAAISDAEIEAMAFRPRVSSARWRLPNVPNVTPAFNTPNNNRDTLVKVCFLNDAGSALQDRGPCLRNSLGRSVETNDPGTYWRVGFKDSALFNGRENLSVRVMDVNLNLLRNSGQSLADDLWLPRRGLIYAFREDTVSEVNIVRPSRATDWNTCNSDRDLQTNADCRILTNLSAFFSRDPPLPPNRISVKPVDYVGDPDRRPNGFRLRQGETLARVGDEGRGLSFISDNPVYIQGNFNLHRANETATTPLEEFTTPLADNFSNFYSRTGRDTNFSGRATDMWRPSEVLADAISIISDNFCDGSIEDFFWTAGTPGTGASLASTTQRLVPDGIPAISLQRYGCATTSTPASVTAATNNRTSYLNANRPTSAPDGSGFARNAAGAAWAHSNVGDFLGNSLTLTGTTTPACVASGPARRVCDPYDPDTATTDPLFEEGDSPIVLSPWGNAYIATNPNASLDVSSVYTDYNSNQRNYYTSGSGRSKNHATQTRVNAIIISGLVPSRPQQSYGGLHNFPRFLEDWGVNYGVSDGNSVPLFISGSLLQLNFSQTATGAFDQDSPEPGQPPGATEVITYYVPPGRRWGYDVGLQIAPAGPVASRFVVIDSIRSEFYSEPPADDPFIARLANCVAATSCLS